MNTNYARWISNTMGAAAIVALLLASSFPSATAQQAGQPSQSQVDTDSDGFSDQLEQSLLTQFAPSFMVGHKDR